LRQPLAKPMMPCPFLNSHRAVHRVGNGLDISDS
jgi:hypothetical protein